MRINKQDPKHWYYLARSGVNVMASLPFRLVRVRNRKKRVVFYDQMNGNIKAFIDYLNKHHKDEYELYFLAFPPHHRLYENTNPEVTRLNILNLRDMIRVARADVIITAFGIETLYYYQKFTGIKFIDVWHGLPFRGYTQSFFHRFKHYSEAWVSSPALAQFYKKWGWKKNKVKITGYARVDALVSNEFSQSQLRRKYNIDNRFKRIILVAPTWEQKDGDHDPLPFNTSANQFLTALNDVGRKTESLVIFRSHLESGSRIINGKFNYVKFMPSSQYTETEELLMLSDMLVSDWSSIVFDYLPLHRPTIFLDVKFPFKDGYTIGREYRFGKIVNNLEELTSAISQYAVSPKRYWDKYADKVKKTERYVWGDTLDGRSAERYYHRLRALTESK